MDLGSGLMALGSSGQNVTDILRNSQMEDPLEAMGALLTWTHMAPTCPDTLVCFPYREKDPFILDELPHVFFAGNQSHFGQSTFVSEGGHEVKLLSVPNFSRTSSLVVLNLKTLEAEEVFFDAV